MARCHRYAARTSGLVIMHMGEGAVFDSARLEAGGLGVAALAVSKHCVSMFEYFLVLIFLERFDRDYGRVQKRKTIPRHTHDR